MAERFTILSTLPQNLYAEGSLVLIAAGNLLKDNQTGRVLAQIKLQSLSNAVIKAATVAVRPLDTTGKPLGETITQEYLDLSVKCGEDFGQKIAIPLPNASTRGMAVSLTRVVFSNNKEWTMEEQTWEALPAPSALEEKLDNEEFIKQYRLTFGEQAQYCPQEHKDLWCCACGTWNHGTVCGVCGSDKADLFDIEALTEAMNTRLAEEERLAAEEAARQEQERIEEEIAAKKRKKTLAIVLPILAFCIVLGIVFTTVILPNLRYNAAVEHYNAGQYEDAIQIFEMLDEYKDSKEYIINSAIALSNAGHSMRAVEVLLTLDDIQQFPLPIADGILAGYQDSWIGEMRDNQSFYYAQDTDTITFVQGNVFYLQHHTEFLNRDLTHDFSTDRFIRGTYTVESCQNGVLELKLLFDSNTYIDRTNYSLDNVKEETYYSGDSYAILKIKLLGNGRIGEILWDDSGSGIHHWYYGLNN